MSPFEVDEWGDGTCVQIDVNTDLLQYGDVHALVMKEPDHVSAVGFRLTNDEAADLYLKLQREIGSWVAEREAARREYEAALDEAGDGLDPSDPKHSNWYESTIHLYDLGGEG